MKTTNCRPTYKNETLPIGFVKSSCYNALTKQIHHGDVMVSTGNRFGISGSRVVT